MIKKSKEANRTSNGAETAGSKIICNIKNVTVI
jgi:hypothetical protein